jgi:diketogulonate reductase-like aldo/keto reductase
MEKLVHQGLTKSIGISNFNKKQTEDILNIATVKPVTNQVCILDNKTNIHKLKYFRSTYNLINLN